MRDMHVSVGVRDVSRYFRELRRGSGAMRFGVWCGVREAGMGYVEMVGWELWRR